MADEDLEPMLMTDPEEEDRQRKALPRPLRVVDLVLRTCQILGMSLVVGLMLLTVAHVVGRYVFSFPMLGVVEVSGLIVVTLVFMSGPYDFMIDRHIAVDVIVRRLSPRVKAGFRIGTYLLSLLVVTLAFIWTFKQGYKVSGSGATTDILRIPLHPFYFVVGFGWLLCAVAIVARIVRFVMAFREAGR